MKKLLILFLIMNVLTINKSYCIVFSHCKAWSYSFSVAGKDTIVDILWAGNCDENGFANGKGCAFYGCRPPMYNPLHEHNRYCFWGEMLHGKPADGEFTFSDAYNENERTYDGIWTWKNGQLNGLVVIAFYKNTTIGEFTNVIHIQGNFVNGKPSGSFICHDENKQEIGKVFSSKALEIWKKMFLN